MSSSTREPNSSGSTLPIPPLLLLLLSARSLLRASRVRIVPAVATVRGVRAVLRPRLAGRLLISSRVYL